MREWRELGTERAAIPDHDYSMPHDTRYSGIKSCPPNCPYLLYYKPEYQGAYMEQDKSELIRDAAYDFIEKCGLKPTPDAVSQLAEAFLPCLQIMCERGYSDPDNPDKYFWQVRGWKGLVHDIMDNAFRLKLFSWERDEFYPNGALDIINFAGFYLRLKNKGRKWGILGEPS